MRARGSERRKPSLTHLVVEVRPTVQSGIIVRPPLAAKSGQYTNEKLKPLKGWQRPPEPVPIAAAAGTELTQWSSSRVPGVHARWPAAQPVGGLAKRGFDIVVASLALVLLAPLMLVIAALLRISGSSPVIYAHTRIGANGRPFDCYKFRTMVVDADKRLERLLSSDPVIAKEWQETHKLRNDPRVTRLGQFLRQSSIDEIPQLFNVLIGDMSCVGPRPVVAAELAPYGPYVEDYLAARPGITGMWQVSGRNSLSYAERVALDVKYVRQWSPMLDAVILLKTIPAVLRFRETA